MSTDFEIFGLRKRVAYLESYTESQKDAMRVTMDELATVREALKVAQEERNEALEADAATERAYFAIKAKLSAIEAQEPVAWVYEDELPSGYPYDLMFPFSKVDGVRLFPIFAPVAPAQPPSRDALFDGSDAHLLNAAGDAFEGESE